MKEKICKVPYYTIISINLVGVPEFNGTGIQKPIYYFIIDLNVVIFYLYIYCEVRLGFKLVMQRIKQTGGKPSICT